MKKFVGKIVVFAILGGVVGYLLGVAGYGVSTLGYWLGLGVYLILMVSLILLD